MSLGYWVAQIESQREHVARLLLMRAQYQTYAPRIKVRGKISWLFPGYLFVRKAERWYQILSTPGVVNVLMTADQPAVVPETIMVELRKRERGGFVQLPRPPSALKAGQPVRITLGCFCGQIAVYQGMSGRQRERVLLELLGQVVPVELPTGSLRLVV